MKEEKKSGNGAAFPLATESERGGWWKEGGPVPARPKARPSKGLNGLAQFLSPQGNQRGTAEPFLKVGTSRMLGQTSQFQQKRSDENRQRKPEGGSGEGERW